MTLAAATISGNKTGSRRGQFPVTHSVFATDALQAAVAKAYRIGAPMACHLVRRGLHDTYLVTAQDDRYIARVYRAQRRTPSDIAYELELLTHLAVRGVSVSAPIETRDGDFSYPLIAPEGPRQLALFTCARGTPLSWEKVEHSYLAGRALAAIHEASDDFVSRQARFRLDLEYLIDTPLAALRPFLLQREPDLRYLQGFAARLRARAEGLVRAGLDWGVCHGDFGGNIHIADDGLPTVFDFDFCGPGWRAYDFIAAFGFSEGWNRTEIRDSFVTGYSETRRVAAADLAAVPLFRVIGRLWSIGMRAGNVDHRGTLPVSDGTLDRRLKYFREWEAQHSDGM